ncbi:MAG: hypothetical protein AAGF77_00110 [Bacteroidota bacterium]
MSSFPRSPKILKGGIVLLNPQTAEVGQIIPLQYNPESITRSLEARSAGDGSDPTEALRLAGPPRETYSIEVTLDATDQLENRDPLSVRHGLQPTLAALESILYPKSSHLVSNQMLAAIGTIEILPTEAPLTLFIWSKERIMPVRFTEFSITEDAFDVNLNPIRAKISLSMTVLGLDDLGDANQGSGLYMAYQRAKEELARKYKGGTLDTLGINL